MVPHNVSESRTMNGAQKRRQTKEEKVKNYRPSNS